MSDKNSRAYYAIIPANIRYDETITPNAKLLYGEITALCNECGYCWATNDYFAQLYNVSKVSVSKWINQLKKRGYLKVEIIYKEGTKEILNRYLRIVTYPTEEKFNTPIKEKFKENNTYINNTLNNNIVEIIDYLNKTCGTRYRVDSKKTITLIKSRLDEKYTVNDFKKVIYVMNKKWTGTEFEQYLRPSTLFNGEKFEGYLNQYKGGDVLGTDISSNTENKKCDKQYEDDVTRALRETGRTIDLTEEHYDF